MLLHSLAELLLLGGRQRLALLVQQREPAGVKLRELAHELEHLARRTRRRELPRVLLRLLLLLLGQLALHPQRLSLSIDDRAVMLAGHDLPYRVAPLEHLLAHLRVLLLQSLQTTRANVSPELTECVHQSAAQTRLFLRRFKTEAQIRHQLLHKRQLLLRHLVRHARLILQNRLRQLSQLALHRVHHLARIHVIRQTRAHDFAQRTKPLHPHTHHSVVCVPAHAALCHLRLDPLQILSLILPSLHHLLQSLELLLRLRQTIVVPLHARPVVVQQTEHAELVAAVVLQQLVDYPSAPLPTPTRDEVLQ